jgi:hypothetical protein
MTSDNFAFTVTLIGAGLGVAAILQDAVRTRLKSRRAYVEWVNGPRQAPSEPMPTAYEQEWLDYGHARDEVPNVVEDWELFEDSQVAWLEEWYGPVRVLPDTPDVLRKLAAL